MKIFVFIFLMPILMTLSIPEAEGVFGKMKRARRCKKYGKRLEKAQNKFDTAQDGMDVAIAGINDARDDIEEEQINLEEIIAVEEKKAEEREKLGEDGEEQENVQEKAVVKAQLNVVYAKFNTLTVKMDDFKVTLENFQVKFDGLVGAMKKFKRKCKSSGISNSTIKQMEAQNQDMAENIRILKSAQGNNYLNIGSGQVDSFICVEGDSSCEGGFNKNEMKEFEKQIDDLTAQIASAGQCTP